MIRNTDQTKGVSPGIGTFTEGASPKASANGVQGLLRRIEQSIEANCAAHGRRHPSHDRRERALGDAPRLLDRSAFADAAHKIHVLLPKTIHRLAGKAPGIRSLDVARRIRHTLGADNPLGHPGGGTDDLPGKTLHTGAVRVLELDRDMVERVSVSRAWG